VASTVYKVFEKTHAPIKALHVLVSAHEKDTETNYWQKGS
jgi:hypothetical protein